MYIPIASAIWREIFDKKTPEDLFGLLGIGRRPLYLSTVFPRYLYPLFEGFLAVC